jgi:hypothetical protein
MTGSDKDTSYIDPEKMTNTELHAHFSKLLVGRAQDVDTQLAAAMEKIAGLEDSFTSRIDAKFQEVLDRLPAPAPAPAAPPAPSGPW